MNNTPKWSGPKLPGRSIRLSREEAASRQIEAAIDALESDDFDIALTLAGAAEGMIVRERRHMFAWLRDHPGAAERFTKDWVSVLNLERDWLKHGGQQNTKIECASAAFMIARAMSKLEMWTPKMDAFKAWLLSNLDNFSTDRGTDR